MTPSTQPFARALRRYEIRFRTAAIAHAALLAAGGAGLALVAGAAAGVPPGLVRVGGAVIFVGAGGVAGVMLVRRWTLTRVAAAVEARHPGCDNAVIAAQEVGIEGRALHPTVAEALFEAAAARLAEIPPHVARPLRLLITLTAGAVMAVVVLALADTATMRTERRERPGADGTRPALRAGEFRVILTPPAYTKQPATSEVNPTAVTVLEGSAVRFETLAPAGEARLLHADGTTRAFEDEGATRSVVLRADASRPIIVRHDGAADRLVYLRVVPDNRPAVSIEQPARDLAFPAPQGQVAFAIDARDDIGLEAVALRYTRVSGTGETFTFEEGEWPIAIAREASGHWRARGALDLAQLKLEDGDTLVYRALARDGKPGTDPSASDTYLIEIGRQSGVASTGFALPDDRERQGLSQQMLIIKTERLHADRVKLSADALMEQSRLLAVEQRMVKAEFVFMTGGEVADEVEEAAHAHELVEGRQENSAQIELFTAIREMSRAEARLNGGDTAQALMFERAALKALQRAFDRRRYLLRALPERTRIDTGRRLTGELEGARSSAASAGAADHDPAASAARDVLRDLARWTPSTSMAVVASRLAGIDGESEILRAAALRVAAASDDTRAAAIREAQRAIVEFLARRLPRGGARLPPREPLRGRLADELRRSEKPQ